MAPDERETARWGIEYWPKGNNPHGRRDEGGANLPILKGQVQRPVPLFAPEAAVILGAMSTIQGLITLLIVLVAAWVVWATYRVSVQPNPRRDRQTGRVYSTYWEWLRDGRLLLMLSLLIGYMFYLMSTDPS